MLPFTPTPSKTFQPEPNANEATACDSETSEAFTLNWNDPVDEWTISNLGIGYTGAPARVMFDREDIRSVLRLEQVLLCPAEFEQFYRDLDRDRDGFVSLKEYVLIPKILKLLLGA